MSNLFEAFLAIGQKSGGEDAPKPPQSNSSKQSSSLESGPGQTESPKPPPNTPPAPRQTENVSSTEAPRSSHVSLAASTTGVALQPTKVAPSLSVKAAPSPTFSSKTAPSPTIFSKTAPSPTVSSKSTPSPTISTKSVPLPAVSTKSISSPTVSTKSVPSPTMSSKSVPSPTVSEAKAAPLAALQTTKQDKSPALTVTEDKVVEIDNLRTFTIPKKRKAKKDLFEKISLASREYTRELLPLVTKTYKDVQGSPKVFTYEHAMLIHNGELLDAYLDRRKEMRQEGYSDKDVSDSYGFLCVESDAQMRQICEEGVKVGNGALSVLGCPTMGVYLSRHADIIKSSGVTSGSQGNLLVFKFIKGKVKPMVENRAGPALEPTPNFDCHVSKAANVDLSSTSPTAAFEATQVYVYEYGDLGPEDRPRQICPYAVLRFTYNGDSRGSRQPTQSRQKLSIGAQRLSNQRSSQPGPTKLSISGGLIDNKTLSSPTDAFSAPPPTARSAKKSTETISSVVGQTAEGSGCVVWEGKLLSKGSPMCGVELLTYGPALRPACIGPVLNIVSRIPLTLVKTKYLTNVGDLRKDSELNVTNKWYRYSLLRPARDSISKFNQVMTYLLKNDSAALVKTDDGAEVIVLTNCDITQKLGLSEMRRHPLVLHLIFISSTSRVEKLQSLSEDKINADHPAMQSPQSQSDPTFKEPPQVKRLTSQSSVDRPFEDGFQKLVSADSLLYRHVLVNGLHEQNVLQERVNAERGCGHLNTGVTSIDPTTAQAGFGQVGSGQPVGGGVAGPPPVSLPQGSEYMAGQYRHDGVYRGPPPGMMGMPTPDYSPGSMPPQIALPGMQPPLLPTPMPGQSVGQQGPHRSPAGMGYPAELTGHNFSPGMMPPNSMMQYPPPPLPPPPPQQRMSVPYMPTSQGYPPPHGMTGYSSALAGPNLPKSLSAGLPPTLGRVPPPPPPPPTSSPAATSLTGSLGSTSGTSITCWPTSQVLSQPPPPPPPTLPPPSTTPAAGTSTKPRPAEGPSTSSTMRGLATAAAAADREKTPQQLLAELNERIEKEKAVVNFLTPNRGPPPTAPALRMDLPMPTVSSDDSNSDEENHPSSGWKSGSLVMTDALADIIVRSAPLAAKAVREGTRKDPRLHRNTAPEPEESSKDKQAIETKKDPPPKPLAEAVQRVDKENKETVVESPVATEVIDSAHDMKALLDEALDKDKILVSPEKEQQRKFERHRQRVNSDESDPTAVSPAGMRKQMQGARKEQLKSWLASQSSPQKPDVSTLPPSSSPDRPKPAPRRSSSPTPNIDATDRQLKPLIIPLSSDIQPPPASTKSADTSLIPVLVTGSVQRAPAQTPPSPVKDTPPRPATVPGPSQAGPSSISAPGRSPGPDRSPNRPDTGPPRPGRSPGMDSGTGPARPGRSLGLDTGPPQPGRSPGPDGGTGPGRPGSSLTATPHGPLLQPITSVPGRSLGLDTSPSQPGRSPGPDSGTSPGRFPTSAPHGPLLQPITSIPGRSPASDTGASRPGRSPGPDGGTGPGRPGKSLTATPHGPLLQPITSIPGRAPGPDTGPPRPGHSPGPDGGSGPGRPGRSPTTAPHGPLLQPITSLVSSGADRYPSTLGAHAGREQLRAGGKDSLSTPKAEDRKVGRIPKIGDICTENGAATAEPQREKPSPPQPAEKFSSIQVICKASPTKPVVDPKSGGPKSNLIYIQTQDFPPASGNEGQNRDTSQITASPGKTPESSQGFGRSSSDRGPSSERGARPTGPLQAGPEPNRVGNVTVTKLADLVEPLDFDAEIFASTVSSPETDSKVDQGVSPSTEVKGPNRTEGLTTGLAAMNRALLTVPKPGVVVGPTKLSPPGVGKLYLGPTRPVVTSRPSRPMAGGATRSPDRTTRGPRRPLKFPIRKGSSSSTSKSKAAEPSPKTDDGADKLGASVERVPASSLTEDLDFDMGEPDDPVPARQASQSPGATGCRDNSPSLDKQSKTSQSCKSEKGETADERLKSKSETEPSSGEKTGASPILPEESSDRGKSSVSMEIDNGRLSPQSSFRTEVQGPDMNKSHNPTFSDHRSCRSNEDSQLENVPLPPSGALQSVESLGSSARPSTKRLTPEWVERLTSINHAINTGEFESPQSPPHTPTKANQANTQVNVPLRNTPAPRFMANTQVVFGQAVDDVRMHLTQEALPVREVNELPYVPDEDILDVSCLTALHRGPDNAMGDEEDDEDQNRIFLWFYGLHLLPSDLARARSELKNKENNPPTADPSDQRLPKVIPLNVFDSKDSVCTRTVSIQNARDKVDVCMSTLNSPCCLASSTSDDKNVCVKEAVQAPSEGVVESGCAIAPQSLPSSDNNSIQLLDNSGSEENVMNCEVLNVSCESTAVEEKYCPEDLAPLPTHIKSETISHSSKPTSPPAQPDTSELADEKSTELPKDAHKEICPDNIHDKSTELPKDAPNEICLDKINQEERLAESETAMVQGKTNEIPLEKPDEKPEEAKRDGNKEELNKALLKREEQNLEERPEENLKIKELSKEMPQLEPKIKLERAFEEISQEGLKDISQEKPEEETKAPPKDIPKERIQKPSVRPEEKIKTAQEKETCDNPEEKAMRAPGERLKEEPKDTSQGMPETLNIVDKEKPKDIPKEEPMDTPQERPKEKPKAVERQEGKVGDMSQGRPEEKLEVPQEKGQKSKETLKEKPKEKTRDTPQERPKDKPEAADKEQHKGKSSDMFQGGPQEKLEVPQEKRQKCKETSKEKPKEKTRDTLQERPKEKPKAADEERQGRPQEKVERQKSKENLKPFTKENPKKKSDEKPLQKNENEKNSNIPHQSISKPKETTSIPKDKKVEKSNKKSTREGKESKGRNNEKQKSSKTSLGKSKEQLKRELKEKSRRKKKPFWYESKLNTPYFQPVVKLDKSVVQRYFDGEKRLRLKEKLKTMASKLKKMDNAKGKKKETKRKSRRERIHYSWKSCSDGDDTDEEKEYRFLNHKERVETQADIRQRETKKSSSLHHKRSESSSKHEKLKKHKSSSTEQPESSREHKDKRSKKEHHHHRKRHPSNSADCDSQLQPQSKKRPYEFVQKSESQASTSARGDRKYFIPEPETAMSKMVRELQKTAEEEERYTYRSPLSDMPKKSSSSSLSSFKIPKRQPSTAQPKEMNLPNFLSQMTKVIPSMLGAQRGQAGAGAENQLKMQKLMRCLAGIKRMEEAARDTSAGQAPDQTKGAGGSYQQQANASSDQDTSRRGTTQSLNMNAHQASAYSHMTTLSQNTMGKQGSVQPSAAMGSPAMAYQSEPQSRQVAINQPGNMTSQYPSQPMSNRGTTQQQNTASSLGSNQMLNAFASQFVAQPQNTNTAQPVNTTSMQVNFQPSVPVASQSSAQPMHSMGHMGTKQMLNAVANQVISQTQNTMNRQVTVNTSQILPDSSHQRDTETESVNSQDSGVNSLNSETADNSSPNPQTSKTLTSQEVSATNHFMSLLVNKMAANTTPTKAAPAAQSKPIHTETAQANLFPSNTQRDQIKGSGSVFQEIRTDNGNVTSSSHQPFERYDSFGSTSRSNSPHEQSYQSAWASSSQAFHSQASASSRQYRTEDQVRTSDDKKSSCSRRDKHVSSSRAGRSARDESLQRGDRDRYHPYRRPRMPPQTPELEVFKQYSVNMPHSVLLQCLTSSSYRARRQVSLLRTSDPNSEPRFSNLRFQRSTWEGHEPDMETRANPRLEDPHEQEEEYTQQSMEDFERRRILCQELMTLVDHTGEPGIPGLDLLRGGGSGSVPSGTPGEKAAPVDDTPTAANDQRPTGATRVPNADDDTFTVVSSNGTLGKKKKKKAKWPGLKYEVSVPPIRREYKKNDAEQLELLDSVVINENDPRHSTSLPPTSIYLHPPDEGDKPTGDGGEPQTSLVVASTEDTVQTEEKNAPKGDGPLQITISVQNDLHQTAEEVAAAEKEAEIKEKQSKHSEKSQHGSKPVEIFEKQKEKKQVVEEEEPEEGELKDDDDEPEKAKEPQVKKAEKESEEMETGADGASSGSVSQKVNSWINASQAYFRDSSHDSDRSDEESSRRPSRTGTLDSAKKTRTDRPTKQTKDDKENACLTSDTVKYAMKDFAKDEEDLFNMKSRTLGLSNIQTAAGEKVSSKTNHMGKLSTAAQGLASTTDAAEAVFSVLHKSRGEMTQVLTEEISKTNAPVRINRSLVSPGGIPQENTDHPERLAEPATKKRRGHLEKHMDGQAQDPAQHVGVDGDGYPPNQRAVRIQAQSPGANEEQQYHQQSYDRNGDLSDHHREVVSSRRAEKSKRRKHRMRANRWSATREKLNGISDYTYSLVREADYGKKAIDKILKHKRKGTIKGLNSLFRGNPMEYSDMSLQEDFQHYKGLSLGTQLECTFIPDSNVVKRAHYDVLKEWMTEKPLDSYLVGKYDVSDIKVEEIKPSLKVDGTVRECLSDFNSDVFQLLKGEDVPMQHLNVFPKPTNDTEDTVDKVFRQVHQYMDFVVSQAQHPHKGMNLLNGQSNIPVTEDLYSESRDRHPSGSSFEGYSDFQEDFSDEERGRKRSKHKHKKKKRKHKKRSKSPDKRKRQQYQDFNSTDEESEHSEPESRGRRQEESEKDCYKPVNAPTKKKTSTGSRPKGITEHGMTHIVEEFYGDVESLLNNSDVSMDGTVPGEQHLPRLKGSHPETLGKEENVDNVIEEEMLKTKLNLLDILKVRNKSAEEKGTPGLRFQLNDKSKVDGLEKKQVDSTCKNPLGSLSSLSSGPTTEKKPTEVRLFPIGQSKEATTTSQSGGTAPAQDDARLAKETPMSFQKSTTRKVSESNSDRIPTSSSQPVSSYERGRDRRSSRSRSPSHRKSIKRKHSPPSRYSNEPRYGYRRQISHSRSNKTPPQPVPGPGAAAKPKVDTTYIDSHTSSAKDPYKEVPVPNFSPFFDVTKAPEGHYKNPYNTWWSIMQYFMDETRTTKEVEYLEKWLPDWDRKGVAGVLPENSFLLALSFATNKVLPRNIADKQVATDDALEFDDITPDMNEYGSLYGTSDITVRNSRTRTLSATSANSSTTDGTGAGDGDGASKGADGKRPAAKRVNTLALAFRQAVEAKKQAAQNAVLRRPFTRKIKPNLRAKAASKIATARANSKVAQTKTTDAIAKKDVQPIPYGEEDTASAGSPSGSPSKKMVPLNVYIEPDLNSRIHSVMEEAMHDVIKHVTGTINRAIGQQRWNVPHLPESFFNPPNQIKHLNPLSDKARALFEDLRKRVGATWVPQKTEASAQTDCSKIPPKQSTPPVEKAMNQTSTLTTSSPNTTSSPGGSLAQTPQSQKSQVLGAQGSSAPVPHSAEKTASPIPMDLGSSDEETAEAPAVVIATPPNSGAQKTGVSQSTPQATSISTGTTVNQAVAKTSTPILQPRVVSSQAARPQVVRPPFIKSSTPRQPFVIRAKASVPLQVTASPVGPRQPPPLPATRPTLPPLPTVNPPTTAPVETMPPLPPTPTPIQAPPLPATGVQPPTPTGIQGIPSSNTSITSHSQQPTGISSNKNVVNQPAPPATTVQPNVPSGPKPLSSAGNQSETSSLGQPIQAAPKPIVAPVSSPISGPAAKPVTPEPIRIMPTVKFSLSKSGPVLSEKPAAFIPPATTVAPLPFVELPPITAETTKPAQVTSALSSTQVSTVMGTAVSGSVLTDSTSSSKPVITESTTPRPVVSTTQAAVSTPVSVATSTITPSSSTIAANSTQVSTSVSTVNTSYMANVPHVSPVIGASGIAAPPTTTTIIGPAERSSIVPATPTATTEISSAPTQSIPMQASPAEPKPSEPQEQQSSTMPSTLGLVSLEPVDIPGFGAPEEAAHVTINPPPGEEPLPMEPAHSGGSEPVTAGAQSSVPSGLGNLDAIPLPPAGKIKTSDNSNKWQEWKKQQQEEGWIQQAETAPEATEVTEWPVKKEDWRKQVEPAPPVSTLTEWPPRSATDPMPPPPLPPLVSQTGWGKNPPVDVTVSPQQHQQPPPQQAPMQQQQPPPGWYGPQYGPRPPWPGGWGPRGPPPRGWGNGGWQGGHWGGGHWGQQHPPRGRGPWDQHPPPRGYWDPQHGPPQQRHPQPHWGGEQQEGGEHGEWGGQHGEWGGPQGQFNHPPPGNHPPPPGNHPPSPGNHQPPPGNHPQSPGNHPPSPGNHPPSINHPPPNHPPPNHPPPNHPPPGNHPPGNHPPGNHPPGNHPPGNHPPGIHPQGNHPPPGNHPPGNYPAGPPPGPGNWRHPPPNWRPQHPPPGYPPGPGMQGQGPPPSLPPHEENMSPQDMEQDMEEDMDEEEEEEEWEPQGPSHPVAPPGEDCTQPVTLGVVGAPKRPLPAQNIRMLVFNQDQPICKSVQRFLTFLGAKVFDPFNVVLIKAVPGVETLVLIHVEDVPQIHEIPNLLALKTQEWVTFVTYESVTDVQHKTYTEILKSGGIAVPDDNIILSLQPESMEVICEFMLKQRREGGEPWYLVVHSHVLSQLLNSRQRHGRFYDFYAREDERMRQLHLILTRYEEAGVVRVLRSPEFDTAPRPSHEYLSVMLRLQAEYAHTSRHTILLTDLPQSDMRALPFLRQGISVMNISSFMRAIVGTPALPPIPQARPYYGMKSDDMFMDSYQSTAVDMLPPMMLSSLVQKDSE